MASGEEYDAVSRRNGAQMHYILGGNKVHAPPNKPKVSAPSKYDKPSITGQVDSKYAAAKRTATRDADGSGYMASTFSKSVKEPVNKPVGAPNTVKQIGNKFGAIANSKVNEENEKLKT